MKTILRVSLFCYVALSAGFALPQKVEIASQDNTIKAKSEEVMIDVIVRDKKGHLVTDLKPDDFQVFDNGQPKRISSFRLVQGSEAVATGGTRTQLDPLRQVRLVTVIFQCSSNDARNLARGAVSDMLKGELPQNVYMSVMTIDHKLEVLQPYTNNLELLRKAVDRATRSEVKDYSADTAMVQKQLQEMLGPNSGALSEQAQVDNAQQAATTAAQGRAPSGADLAGAAMARIVLEMLETQQASAAAEGGRINIYALLDAVREQYRLPGRKTVLYFSEGGFKIPQGMEQPFKNVISTANRANVSFYSIDARGLSTFYSADSRGRATYGANSDATSALSSATQASQRQFNDTGEPISAREEGERAKSLDKALDSTRSNTQNTLASLAESTGGSLIANTNDLKTPIHRVEEDIQTYYEIAYAPEIKTYDGSFHTVSVKMNSNDLRVQSRSGYVALPPELAKSAGNLRAYEVPLLSALSQPQLPHDLAFQSTTMHFRGDKDNAMCVLAIDVPMANLSFAPKGKDEMEGHLSYIALVKNEKSEVIKKFQNEIPINVSTGKMDAVKTSHFIYTEHFELPPGHYTVDTAVLDSENGNKVGARKSSMNVSLSSSTLGLSSVSFIRNMKDKEPTTAPEDPLLVGSKVVSPALNPIVPKDAGSGLPFYLIAYTDKSAQAAPKLIMDFSKDGQELGQASPELGQPDQDGRIQYVGTVPTASLQPGEYTIRFLLQQGNQTAEEAAFFTVQ
jgi:VWFA-related protein